MGVGRTRADVAGREWGGYLVLMTGQRAGKAGGLGKGSGQAREQAEGFRAHATHLDARGIYFHVLLSTI